MPSIKFPRPIGCQKLSFVIRSKDRAVLKVEKEKVAKFSCSHAERRMGAQSAHKVMEKAVKVVAPQGSSVLPRRRVVGPSLGPNDREGAPSKRSTACLEHYRQIISTGA
jgi:hypothetical protein